MAKDGLIPPVHRTPPHCLPASHIQAESKPCSNIWIHQGTFNLDLHKKKCMLQKSRYRREASSNGAIARCALWVREVDHREQSKPGLWAVNIFCFWQISFMIIIWTLTNSWGCCCWQMIKTQTWKVTVTSWSLLHLRSLYQIDAQIDALIILNQQNLEFNF